MPFKVFEIKGRMLGKEFIKLENILNEFEQQLYEKDMIITNVSLSVWGNFICLVQYENKTQ